VIAISDTKQRLDYLDSLRGWAILGVLLIHCGAHFPGPIATATTDGARGVELFFMLSAMTLFHTGRTQHAGEVHALRNFFIRRFFRIAPMFYLVSLFFFVRSNIWYSGGTDVLFNTSRTLANLTFIFNFVPQFMPPLFGEWSIGLEVAFYAIVPLLFRWVRDLDHAIYLLLGAMLVGGTLFRLGELHPLMADKNQWANYMNYSFPNHWSSFAFGILAYFIIQRPIHPKHAPALLAVALYVGILVWSQPWFYIHGLPHHLQFDVAFLALVVALHLRRFRLFVNRPLSYLGRISFSVYLLHDIVKDNIKDYVLVLGLPPPLSFALLLAVVTALTAGLSALSYKYVELPGIALGKKLIRKLDARTAGAEVTALKVAR
jgi:peptidoglycan/LPS O-acetylase OafA/YrhL